VSRGAADRKYRIIGWLLVAVGTSGVLILLTGVSLFYRNPDASCLYRVAPPGAEVSEAITPTGQVLWMPIGLECRYPAEDGSLLVVPPDAVLTYIVVALAAVAIVGCCFLLVRNRPIPVQYRNEER
jgi:hypothetical protein